MGDSFDGIVRGNARLQNDEFYRESGSRVPAQTRRKLDRGTPWIHG